MSVLKTNLKMPTLSHNALEFGIWTWQEGELDILLPFPYPPPLLWSYQQINLISLSIPNHHRLASGLTGTPQLTIGSSNVCLYLPLAYPPSIPAYILDQNSYPQPLQIHIQSVEGMQLSHTQSWPSSISGTPKSVYWAQDIRSISVYTLPLIMGQCQICQLTGYGMITFAFTYSTQSVNVFPGTTRILRDW